MIWPGEVSEQRMRRNGAEELACMWCQEFRIGILHIGGRRRAIHSGARDGKSKVDNRHGQPEISIDCRKSVFLSQNQGIWTERLGSGPDYTTL